LSPVFIVVKVQLFLAIVKDGVYNSTTSPLAEPVESKGLFIVDNYSLLITIAIDSSTAFLSLLLKKLRSE